jgi:hypothetical protein
MIYIQMGQIVGMDEVWHTTCMKLYFSGKCDMKDFYSKYEGRRLELLYCLGITE